MTDSFSSNGLQVSTNAELVENLTTSFQSIYGSDISVDQNSPDGQMINIFAQGQTDIRELLVQIYNSFDPDNCSGRLLDEPSVALSITYSAKPVLSPRLTYLLLLIERFLCKDLMKITTI